MPPWPPRPSPAPIIEHYSGEGGKSYASTLTMPRPARAVCGASARGLNSAALDGLHQLGVVALGLVAIAFREISQGAVQRVAVAAVAPMRATSPDRACARDNSDPQTAPQKSNGVPVMSGTGIDAFMFFICRT